MQWHVEDQWLSYDFGVIQEVGQVCIRWDDFKNITYGAESVRIDTSLDGVVWSEGATTYTSTNSRLCPGDVDRALLVNASLSDLCFDIDEVQARHVRLNFGLATDPWQLWLGVASVGFKCGHHNQTGFIDQPYDKNPPPRYTPPPAVVATPAPTPTTTTTTAPDARCTAPSACATACFKRKCKGSNRFSTFDKCLANGRHTAWCPRVDGIYDASCAAFVETCDGVEGACYEARCQEEFATVDACESAGDDHLWCDGPAPAAVPVPTLAPTREPMTTADPEPDSQCPEQPRRRLTDCVTYPCACQDHPGQCIVVGSMGEGGVPCSAGIRPHITEEFCNTVTETEGGFCGGEKYPVAAGAFCKWTFCPALPEDKGRRLDALPLLTAAVSRAMASVQLENATADGLAELRRAVAKLEQAKALLASGGASKGSRTDDRLDDVVSGKRSFTDDVVARARRQGLVDDRTDDKTAKAARAVSAVADARRGGEAQRRVVEDQRRLVAEEKALLASEAKLAAARDLAAAKVDAARAHRALAFAADARLGGDVM